MQGIGNWLTAIGLEQHTEKFLDNDIGIDILGELTDQDLKERSTTGSGLTLHDKTRILLRHDLQLFD